MADEDCRCLRTGPQRSGCQEPFRKVQGHPCYDEKAQHLLGRIHLAVAPRCNLRCNYCVRRFDCAHESRPGVTSRLLTPAEGLERVREVVGRFPEISVVGIAGPGDPLANPETFETLTLVGREFPGLQRCLSTNGLWLPEKLDLLLGLGVSHLTLTLNAVDPHIGQRIYAWVSGPGRGLMGLEGAKLLLSRQLLGLEKAAAAGIKVKVNAVLIPTVNEDHLIEVAQRARELGAFAMNILPLIPQRRFAHLAAPTPEQRRRVQEVCAQLIPQVRHCRQCRADAVGLLGEERQPDEG